GFGGGGALGAREAEAREQRRAHGCSDAATHPGACCAQGLLLCVSCCCFVRVRVFRARQGVARRRRCTMRPVRIAQPASSSVSATAPTETPVAARSASPGAAATENCPHATRAPDASYSCSVCTPAGSPAGTGTVTWPAASARNQPSCTGVECTTAKKHCPAADEPSCAMSLPYTERTSVV